MKMSKPQLYTSTQVNLKILAFTRKYYAIGKYRQCNFSFIVFLENSPNLLMHCLGIQVQVIKLLLYSEKRINKIFRIVIIFGERMGRKFRRNIKGTSNNGSVLFSCGNLKNIIKAIHTYNKHSNNREEFKIRSRAFPCPLPQNSI